MSKQRRTIHTSRTRRRDNNIPSSLSVDSSVVSNSSLTSRTSSIIPLSPNIIAYPSGAAALLLLFSLVSLAQISSILNSSDEPNNFSVLRRTLQSEENSKLPIEFIIPIADRATNRDVAILWHDADTPLAPSVNSYYQCIGKTVTGKNSGHPAHEIKDDWNDSMIRLALSQQDISELVKSGEMNDLMVMTSRPSNAARSYLSERQHGRILGLFRHPVDVVSSHFAELKNSNIDEATFIEDMDSDIMVKKIVGLNPSDAVSVADVKVAMDFIRDYVVVGLISEMEESLRRFNLALGMDERQNSNCTIHSDLYSQDQEHAIARNSLEWNAIAQKSPLDMMLYRFIENLYEEQYEIFDTYSELEELNDQVIQWSDVFNSTHLADFDAPFTRNERETPFFWHISRSGGSSLQDLYWCMGYTLANHVGGEPRFHKIVPRHILMEFQPWKEYGITSKVLNVDMTTRNGIVNAKTLGLFSVKQVPKPDLIYSTQFYALSTILFSSHHIARSFSLFRHPVDRAVSRFTSLQKINKAWANLSVNDWAIQDNNHEANWMVRELVGKGQDDDLDITDVEVAKVIVRDKFIVGLSNKYQESLRRFNIVMGVDKDSEKGKACMESHPDVPEESTSLEQGNPAYVTLMSVNFLDVMLYQYVEVLFDNQARLFQSEEESAVS